MDNPAELRIAGDRCGKCQDWGETVLRGTYPNCPFPIPCPECGRLTWPNLGVNCPAGMAFALSASYWSTR